MKLIDIVSNFIERIPRRLIWALGMFSVALIITFLNQIPRLL